MPKSQSHKRPLLIVEDNLMCQQIYLCILNEDYSVDLVATVSEALDYLEKQSYHCIILDLGLPDKSGEELLPLIRANPLNNNTPILVISAHVNEEIKQRCVTSGANQVFTKPIEARLLKELLAKS